MENLTQKNEVSKIPSWLGIIIVLALGLNAALLVIGIMYLKMPLPEVKTTQEEIDLVPEPKEVFSYLGKITKFEPGKIIFQAQAVRNYLDEDTLITALVTDETQYLKIGVPKILPKDIKEGEGASLFSRQEISPADLKIGDEITAVADVNIRGKNEFKATRIEIIIAAE